MLITLLAFVVTLGVLIIVHEYGHYRMAVACGVRVLRFSVGFGRVLWRKQRSPESTEFVVCALPLGGYVRMLDEREAPVPANELDRAFNRKPLWQRAAIVASGPVANLLLAIALYAVAHWIGVDEPKALVGPPVAGSSVDRAGLRAGDWVRAWSNDGLSWTDVRSLTDLRWQLTQSMLHGDDVDLLVSNAQGHGSKKLHVDLKSIGSGDVDLKTMNKIGIAGPWSEPVLGEVKAGSAGAQAGLRAGDRIVSIDGRPIVDASEARELIRAAGKTGEPQPMRWRIERDGQRLDLTVVPAIAVDAGSRVGRLEVFPGQPPVMTSVRYGPIDGVTSAVTQTWEMSALTLKMLGKMVIGQASIKNLSGPVTIADFAGQSVRLGLAYYLGFLAVVSVSLGVLNLLPLPVLDGGHLMYYLFEAVTGRPVSEWWLERLQRGGVAIMVVMMSLAIYNDMARLFGQQ